MFRAALADIYHRQRGVQSVFRRWPELSNLDALLNAMSDSIEVSVTGLKITASQWLDKMTVQTIFDRTFLNFEGCLTGQVPILAGHCLLTGRYFEPWCYQCFVIHAATPPFFPLMQSINLSNFVVLEWAHTQKGIISQRNIFLKYSL